MLPHLREEFKSFKVSMYHLIVTFLFFFYPYLGMINLIGMIFVYVCLDGGFQYFLFSSLFREDSQFD